MIPCIEKERKDYRKDLFEKFISHDRVFTKKPIRLFITRKICN